MKTHLIKVQSITDYVLGHQNSKIPFDNWLLVLRYASWNQPSDILNTFPSADLLGDGRNRVIFNIGGNRFRLICSYHFGKREAHLFVCWMGTHADYTQLCAKNLQYTVSDY